MPALARLSTPHVCLLTTGGVPHVGGPILGPGAPGVLLGGVAVALVGDVCACLGPPDGIATGSTSVLVGGQPVARVGDTTIHGGMILPPGFPTVIVGR